MMRALSFVALLFLAWGCGGPVAELRTEPQPPPQVAWAMEGGSPGRVSCAAVAVSPAWHSRDSIRLVEEDRYKAEENAGVLLIDGVAYVGHSDKRFDAIRLADEERLWSVPTAGGIHTTAAYSDGILVFGDDHGVVTAVNLQGQVLWSFTAEYPVVSSPLIANDKVYIGVSDQNVFCLDVVSGTPVWQYGKPLPRRHGLWRALGLCYGEGRVFVGFADGTLVALDAALGRVLWRREIGSPKLFGDVSAGPSFADGRVFAAAFGGPVVCLDAANGDPYWRTEVSGVSGFAVGDEALYLGTPEGEVVSLSRASGEELWRVPLDGGIPASPVLAGDAVVTSASRGGMYVLAAADGTVRYHFLPGPGVRAQAVVGDEGIVFHSNGGVLHWVHKGASWD